MNFYEKYRDFFSSFLKTFFLFVIFVIVSFVLLHVVDTKRQSVYDTYDERLEIYNQELQTYNHNLSELLQSLKDQNKALETMLDLMEDEPVQYDFTKPKYPVIPNIQGSKYEWFTQDHEKLLNAIAIVESNNDSNAVGDNGNSLGMYQIQYVYWIDAVEHDPSIGGLYQDVLNPEYARKIVLSYFDRYGRTYNYKVESLARIHNGGPNGPNKQSTIQYWNRIKHDLH